MKTRPGTGAADSTISPTSRLLTPHPSEYRRERDAAASDEVHGAPLDTTSTPHASTPTSWPRDYPSRAPPSSRRYRRARRASAAPTGALGLRRDPARPS